MLRDILEIRAEFPALKQIVNSKDLVYFDNAATAQKPNAVINRLSMMNSGVNGNIHRAVHELSARSTQLYEESRDSIKEFINARSREEIIFTSGATASINLVASSFAREFLKKDDVVILSVAEHHSNIVPWQIACEQVGAKIKVLPIDDSGTLMIDDLDSMIDKHVKIISVTHVSNVLGLVNPIEDIIKIAHAKGVPVMIDGAQGIVHCDVDVQNLDCDFYVFSGHKLYGPTGTGVLYGKREILEKMPPWQGGGDMVSTVSFERTTYAELPLKFEAGTPNYIGNAALRDAISFVKSIEKEEILKKENEIIDYFFEEFKAVPGLTLYGTKRENKIPLFSFNIDGVHPTDLAMLLDKMGIAIRSGQMCCEPLMKRFGLNGMARVSLLPYNTLEEASYFIKSLKRATRILLK